METLVMYWDDLNYLLRNKHDRFFKYLLVMLMININFVIDSSHLNK